MHPVQRQEQKQDENNQLSTVSLTNTFTGKHIQDGTQLGELHRETFPRLLSDSMKQSPSLPPAPLYFLLGTAS